MNEMAVHLNPWKERLEDMNRIINRKEDNYLSDKLSQKIWRFYVKNTQNYKLFEQKIRLKNKLSQTLAKYFNENCLQFIDIYFSGSTANGLATIDSDIDLCFVVTDFYDLEFVKSKKLRILGNIENILELNDFKLIDCQLIPATVPILRYIDSRYKIQVEINVNNEIGIRNTRLLYCYSKLDWRVTPVCIAIKRWAKHYQIIDSFSGLLSSYCIELMVIFYLQNCLPPILPCLQRTNADIFDPNADIKSYKELPDLEQLLPFHCTNNESLSDIFIGFFKYYLFTFNFAKQVASVRLGKPLEKRSFIPYLSDANQWEFVCIEEPFSKCNSARTLYEKSAYIKLINGFKEMYDKSVEVIDSICDCN